MPNLFIDDREVEVPAGSTILDACRVLDIHVPTLCFGRGYKHFTSCMLCVVLDRDSGKMLPACSALALDELDIETNSEAVRASRRAALELLLSDHLGDCEGPCRRACPAHMNIPLMIRQIAGGALEQAIATVKADIALPAVLGRICPAPCEKACRRRELDEPVSICLLKRFVADTDLAGAQPFAPRRAAPSRKRVAVVGAGPTGLAAAYYLVQMGHGCALLDQQRAPGGALRSAVPEWKLPRSVLDAEIRAIRALGVVFRLQTRVGKDVSIEELKDSYDVVVLAVGPLNADAAGAFGIETTERGLRVASGTGQTSDPRVFAGGGAVGPSRMAVRAVADGKRLATVIDRMLRTGAVEAPRKRFNSVIGRLKEEEKTRLREQARRGPAVTPAGGHETGFTRAEATDEALRCLHCDCRKPESCRLRRYAEEYEAKQARFKPAERRSFERLPDKTGIVFEQGKCISCGLCVRITEKHEARLGLSFVGRGASTRIGVPFREPLHEGLEEAVWECVENCPTGALTFSESGQSERAKEGAHQ